MTNDLAYSPEIVIPTRGYHPDDQSINYIVLAEGDSWFSLGSFPGHNILKELKFARDTRIVSLAEPGDKICHMATREDNPGLEYYLCKKQFCSHFDLILLSGGGNDLIDEAKSIITFENLTDENKEKPESYINQDRLTCVLGAISDAYVRIANMRDDESSLSKGVPIVTHTYAYPTPRKSPALIAGTNIWAIGPWLFPIFDGAALSDELKLGITDIMFNQLAGTILSLNNKIANFHAIDTRLLLDRAESDARRTNHDWENEIHPTRNGYEKIAELLSEEICKILNH